MIRAEFQKEKICSTHFLVIDVKALKEVYAAFRSQRFEDSQLDSFMHRLEQSIGLRDEHGKLTLLGLEVTV